MKDVGLGFRKTKSESELDYRFPFSCHIPLPFSPFSPFSFIILTWAGILGACFPMVVLGCLLRKSFRMKKRNALQSLR